MNPTFWRDKRVFVTGHTGFKGAWLCMLLSSFGARVAGYALPPPTQPSLYELARVDELVDSTVGDVRDFELLCDHVGKFAPAICFPYGSAIRCLALVRGPCRNLLDQCPRHSAPSGGCSPHRRRMHGGERDDRQVLREHRAERGLPRDAPLGGRDPYSSSKACAEFVGSSYRDSFFSLSRFAEHGVALASARAGNVIGGGDWTPRQLIPDTIAAFLSAAGRAAPSGAVRPWQHVLDCLTGYLMLAEALAGDAQRYSGAWNFGPAETDALPCQRVVESLARTGASSKAWVKDDASHAPEEHVLRLDSTKAATFLHWSRRFSIDEALRWVADWYRDFHAGRDARALATSKSRLPAAAQTAQA